MNKSIIIFIFLITFIININCFLYQESQYNNNACHGEPLFTIRTKQCSNEGYIKKINTTHVMVIHIRSSDECIESNNGEQPTPKPTTTPSTTPTPTNNNGTNNASSTETGSQHSNSTSTETGSQHSNTTSTKTGSQHSNTTSSENGSHHNSTSTEHSSNSTDSSSSSSSSYEYIKPKIYLLNECNLLPDGTSIFVTVDEKEDPIRELNYCNDVTLLDNNCDNALVRTYKNFTCISKGKTNDTGIPIFQRISCRSSLQSIDYDYCLHDCTNTNCNYNYTLPSNAYYCPDIVTVDTTHDSSSSLSIYNCINNNLLIFLIINFLFYIILF